MTVLSVCSAPSFFMKRKVRISAKAIIVRDGNLLAMHHIGIDGDYYLLPGGGQKSGESLAETVERECMEEAGVVVKASDVLYIRDYIEANHEFAGERPGFHQVEIMFQCEIVDDSEIGNPLGMDARQIGICWIPLVDIETFNFFPKELKEILKDSKGKRNKVYLGDIN